MIVWGDELKEIIASQHLANHLSPTRMLKGRLEPRIFEFGLGVVRAMSQGVNHLHSDSVADHDPIDTRRPP